MRRVTSRGLAPQMGAGEHSGGTGGRSGIGQPCSKAYFRELRHSSFGSLWPIADGNRLGPGGGVVPAGDAAPFERGGMHQRASSTETGWVLAKAAVLVVVLGTLSGFTVLSHLVSHASVGRIDCLDNQRATYDALLAYQAEHDGAGPRNLDLLSRDPQSRSPILGRCPVDDRMKYRIDAASGRVICPNPAHRPGS
jgi:hypothetical protein